MIRFFVKTHRWVGLVASLFVIVFALSGIFLNHRAALSTLDLQRSSLPQHYSYSNWNNASIKGSHKLSPDSILLFGGSGIWLSDSTMSRFSDFTAGVRKGADNRNCTNIVTTNSGEHFALTTFDLYWLEKSTNSWKNITKQLGTNERLADVAVRGDSLVVITRSNVYTALPPYSHFTQQEIAAPEGYKREISLYRLIWTLHSGEAFGMAGRVVVDLVGVVAIILSLTGIVVILFPSLIKRSSRRRKRLAQFRVGNLKWHNKAGAWFFVLSLVVVLTGLFLRPPSMILVIRGKVPPIWGTVQSSDNPWFEKLRTIRYDNHQDDWLLYTSEGLYKLKELDSQPQLVEQSPPISVMGVSVLEQLSDDEWAVGSFSGFYRWNRTTNRATDIMDSSTLYLNGEPTGDIITDHYKGIMGNIDVAGYSNHFDKELIFSYSAGALSVDSGTPIAEMPQELKEGTMSLWHLSLEAHTGRIYTFMVRGVLGESIFITISGVLILLIYISGYVVYRVLHRKKQRKELQP